jgi:hypothetical protein
MNYWTSKKKPIERKTWSCPLEGVIKINADATSDVDQGAWSMEAKARDFEGIYMMARCKELHFVTDSHMAEAYAPREGLRQAQQIGSDKFNLQSNNIQMIETMKNGGYI